ncbi:MAG TPA: phosphoglycolate phosphatase [Burkholderiales bacterium]|nr:phosphoglycolate phosphatase [Burkholderiales bacterium]
MKQSASPKAALIDLDGTLVDSAPDLAAAANRMLDTLGLPRRSIREISNYVGKGITRLVERALTGELDGKADPALLARALPVFAEAYDEESGRHSRVFDGVVEGLERITAPRACVTNKAERFTLPLLERMGLARYFDAVVCGDHVARGKPDPLAYLVACERLGARPAEVLVIGDSENDVLAARAGGMRVVCVRYGYREGRSVESLGADAVVADLREAAAYFHT